MCDQHETADAAPNPSLLSGDGTARGCLLLEDAVTTPSLLQGRRPVDHAKVMDLTRLLFEALGCDPTEPGLADTPRRVADWWREFLDHEPGTLTTTFPEAVNAASGMVVVSGVRVWSLCEHHLLPFWCDVSVAYRPSGAVLGLSKFGRLAHAHAHRLQLQERLVTGIADDVVRLTGATDVAVLGRGEHLCMTMRGVRTPHRMTTSSYRGAFEGDAALRAEFLRLAGAGEG